MIVIENPCKRNAIYFHGYTILRCGTVIGKSGEPLKTSLRPRNGGGNDLCVRLYYRGKQKKWTLSRLIAACFLGPIDGYEINHKDRNPMNCHVDNLERTTPRQNQQHWRNNEKQKSNVLFTKTS